MGPHWRPFACSTGRCRASTCTWTRASRWPCTARARRPTRYVAWSPARCVCVMDRVGAWLTDVMTLVAGPDGAQQLFAGQHDHLRRVAGRVGCENDPAALGTGRGRRRPVARGRRQFGGPQGVVGLLVGGRPARDAFVALLVPPARPAGRRVDVRSQAVEIFLVTMDDGRWPNLKAANW